MDIVQTQRGFSKGKFKDQYGLVCSIQESSLASDTRQQVSDLLPLLQRFVDTGSL